jgi:VIT1/CCC1 family predicted Fe2+/Mn2+ transporter
MASLLEPQEIESLKGKLIQISQTTVWPRLAKEDWLGALGLFLLVFLSLFPVVVPFIFISNAGLALRISNVVALVLLFLAGIHSGASLIATLGERGFPWSFLGLRWSP